MSIRVVADAAAVAEAAAAALVEQALAAIGRTGRFTLALSGGSTPRLLHARLADPGGPFRPRVLWTSCQFFWGDERHVPPDHADSNFRMARETLLDPLGIADAQIHRMRGDLPAADAATRYQEELERFFGPQPFPRFDLILLGMGPDGHTASLFPGTSAVHERSKWVVAPWVEKLKTFRITLTPPVINAASHVTFVVAGGDKAGALRDVIEGPRDPDRLPAQVIAPVSGSLDWVVDKAAAARLTAA